MAIHRNGRQENITCKCNDYCTNHANKTCDVLGACIMRMMLLKDGDSDKVVTQYGCVEGEHVSLMQFIKFVKGEHIFCIV